MMSLLIFLPSIKVEDFYLMYAFHVKKIAEIIESLETYMAQTAVTENVFELFTFLSKANFLDFC